MKITPMLRFLRALTPEQREAFASAVGSTTGYLYQLAAQRQPNPRLRLAKAIEVESARIAPRVKTEPLTLDDLLIGPTPEERDER